VLLTSFAQPNNKIFRFENSSLLACGAVSQKRYMTSQRNAVPSGVKQSTHLDCQALEDNGATILPKVKNHSASDTTSNARGNESSAKPM
jgi:hypothetical protein